MSEIVRKRVVVSGVVQGVWFRASTAEEAREVGVHGWVRNRPDGTVEAAFEGPEGGVDRMVDWIGHGPERARVEHVDVTSEKPEGLRGFEVR
ncbi:MAG: acylphosphatase [Coriobacteriales bacterium]|nr:acylphosphatase [Coriobacteriales bacterium]